MRITIVSCDFKGSNLGRVEYCKVPIMHEVEGKLKDQICLIVKGLTICICGMCVCKGGSE